MGTEAITIEHLGLHYARGGIDDVSFSLARGSFTGLVGASGCGKTSLLRLVAGLETADSGRVMHVAGRVAYVFQEPALMAWRDVAGNIALPLRVAGFGAAEIVSRTDEALELVGLSAHAAAMPRELSGGMRMRVSLARALALRSQLLLMDEPFAALDELTRERLEDDLRAIWTELKCTILFVTHSITESVYLAERVLVMRKGAGHYGTICAEIDVPTHGGHDFKTTTAFHQCCSRLRAHLAAS